MGKREKEKGKSQVCHQAFYDNMKNSQNSVVVVENVCEYDGERIVQQALGNIWKLEVVRIDPRIFGFASARARMYLVAYRSDKLRWAGPWTLQSFVEMLRSRVEMSVWDYFWMKLPKSQLSQSNETRLNT